MLKDRNRTHEALKINVTAPHGNNNDSARREDAENILINVPEHVQPSLDKVLDYYAESGKRPLIKLCGGPLDIVSDFITQTEATLPANLLNNGRDVLDFIIHNICEFCRDKSVTHMTFNFTFNHKHESTLS